MSDETHATEESTEHVQDDSGPGVLDRVTDLFEKWAAEENQYRVMGEYGLAEGMNIAINDLRAAVHGAPECPICGSTKPGGTPSCDCEAHRDAPTPDGAP